MEVKIEEGWKNHLSEEFEKPYFRALTQKVRQDYADPTVRVYPPGKEIFAAFDASPFDATKVVIIGQDPYHGPGQANGLCFSVAPGVMMPPSLVNIFKEVSADTGAPMPADGDLSRWARQGVLLLNSSLTVREHAPKVTFRNWMGDVYRCRRQCTREREGGAGVHAVGIGCHKEGCED